MRDHEPGVSAGGAAITALATLACLLPFAGKAFHVDDPLNLWMARQIHESPAEFFDLSVNWSGTRLPFAMESKNPPGVGFYTAAAAALAGWSEWALHLAFLLPALAVTLALRAVARRLGADPLLASLTCLTFPVFLVSATTLMSDVPMLALWCLSLASWMRGIEEKSRGALLCGALLAALCALTKYFGIALLPLLAVWTLARERRLGAWALYLWIPVAAIGAYELYTARVFGAGLIQYAAGFSWLTRPGETGAAERLGVSLVFAGGAFASLLFLAPVALSRRGLLAGSVGAAILGLACLTGGPLAELCLGPGGPDPNALGHLVVFAGAGALLWVLLLADASRHRDAGSVLLVCWTLGTFAFAAQLNYTTNGRSLLPMAPALALVVGRLGLARGVTPLLRILPLLPAAALAMAVAWGDASLADSARQAARRIDAEHSAGPGARWFEGHWGFQLYLEEAGWRPVDVRIDVLRPGDRLATPLSWKQPLGIPQAAATQVELLEIPTAPLTTMAPATGTGFYAIQWGPLPWRWQAGHAEGFLVRRIDAPVIFERDPVEVERRRAQLAEADRWLAGVARAPDAAFGPACAAIAPELATAVARHCARCSRPEDCRRCAAGRAADPRCAESLDPGSP